MHSTYYQLQHDTHIHTHAHTRTYSVQCVSTVDCRLLTNGLVRGDAKRYVRTTSCNILNERLKPANEELTNVPHT